jgi:cytochrome c553
MLKRIAIGLGVVLGLVVVAVVALYFVGSSKVDRTYAVQTASLTIPTDSASIARGAHLVNVYGCTDCHGEDLSGQVYADGPPFRVTATNLTRGEGGIGATYTAEDFDRAIRHGVKPDGRSLLIMPSPAFHGISDYDMAAMIAYLQQVEPVDAEHPPTEVRLMGRLLAAGPLDPASEVRVEQPRGTAPAPGPTAEYGAYLAQVCAYCHGENMEGLLEPPGPPGMTPAPGLAASGGWTFEEFQTALRTGVRPNGTEVDTKFMPIALTRHFSDEEMRALHAYFGTLTETKVAAGTDA